MPLHAGAIQGRVTIRGGHPLAALLREIPTRDRPARLLQLAEAGAASHGAGLLRPLQRALERLAPAGETPPPETPPAEPPPPTGDGGLSERLSSRWSDGE